MYGRLIVSMIGDVAFSSGCGRDLTPSNKSTML